MARKKDYLHLWIERLEMTEEEVAEQYWAWYEAAVKEMGRTAALEMLADALYTSESTVQRYASRKRLPAGEFLALICHRLEKSIGFGLELGDKALDNTILTLHQDRMANIVSRDAERLRRDRKALDEQERRLDEREQKMDERDKELYTRKGILDRQLEVNDRRTKSVSDRELKVEEREKAAKAEEERLRRLGRPTTEQEVIAAAMKRRGRLAPSIKSILLAKLESDEETACRTANLLSRSQATKRRVQREEHERVLAILTFPIRLLVDWLMP